MKRLAATKGMDKREWLLLRKKGIGGSDTGAICGLNPYKTAMQVYLDKTTDTVEEIDNEAMRQGREFEDYVARRFMEATGKKVRRANFMFLDEERPFMLADVDRMIVGENAGLECKTASPYMADKWAEGKIPLSYQLQCMHYMSVMNCDRWYIAVLIYGRKFKYYCIERDEQMISDLRAIEEDFWKNHVECLVIPEPDGSELADKVISEYYPHDNEDLIQLRGFDQRLERREELTGLIERMEKEKKKIEQELKIFIGENGGAENDYYRVTWKSVSSERFDSRLFKAEQPEVYRRYLRKSESRRFSVKVKAVTTRVA